MTCDEALILLSGYLDNRNTEEEMALLRGHLEHCPDCRNVLRNLEEIEQGVAALAEEPPAGFSASVMNAIRAESKRGKMSRRWVPAAIAAVLVLTVGTSQLNRAKMDLASENTVRSDMAAPAAYSRSLLDTGDRQNTGYEETAAAVDSRQLAERLGGDVVVTRELLPEMEVCPCETLEDGSLLYHLDSAEAAAGLSEKYGLELFASPAEAGDRSYARLIS